MLQELFTIGYASHSPDSFLDILRHHRITAVADVRSLPYSQYKPEFNREGLKAFLAAKGIAYVFLGDCCGARVEDPSCYVDGQVDFNLVAQNRKFQEGLDRIRNGLEKYRIVLMCAEKDPLTCHRTILICRNLCTAAPEITINHILDAREVETHQDSEYRLLKQHSLDHPDLFRNEQQRLAEAYMRQGKLVAYKSVEYR